MVADYAGNPHKKNVQFCTVNSDNWRKLAISPVAVEKLRFPQNS
jgi:hypothetical protein